MVQKLLLLTANVLSLTITSLIEIKKEISSQSVTIPNSVTNGTDKNLPDIITIPVSQGILKIYYNGTDSNEEKKHERILIRWKDYANTWGNFYTDYRYLQFGEKSIIKVLDQKYQDVNKLINYEEPVLGFFTSEISANVDKKFSHVQSYYDGGAFGATVILEGYLRFWVAGDYIYWGYHFNIKSTWSSESSFIELNIKEIFISRYWRE